MTEYKLQNYKEIRRTTESHWSFWEPSAPEEKLDLFLLSFLFVKPLTVHYLVHSEPHNLTLDSVPNQVRTFHQG